jgi:hypothetical protein
VGYPGKAAIRALPQVYQRGKENGRASREAQEAERRMRETEECGDSSVRHFAGRRIRAFQVHLQRAIQLFDQNHQLAWILFIACCFGQLPPIMTESFSHAYHPGGFEDDLDASNAIAVSLPNQKSMYFLRVKKLMKFRE